MHVTRRMTVGASLLLLATLPALAQDAYPTRPIQMIVPFPPGGVADITGRPTAMVMGQLLKQSVMVVNKSGAGGSVALLTAIPASLSLSVPSGISPSIKRTRRGIGAFHRRHVPPDATGTPTFQDLQAVIEAAKRLPELGASRILLHDAAGVLQPHRAGERAHRAATGTRP